MADFVFEGVEPGIESFSIFSPTLEIATPFGVPTPPATEIESIVQIALNAVRVTFTGPVRAFDPGDVHDALHVPAWALSVLSPYGAALPLVQVVEAVSPVGGLATQVIVRFDGRLDEGAAYHLSAFQLYDSTPTFVGGCPL